MMHFLYLFFLLFSAVARECEKNDIRYEYTECNASRGRWRVPFSYEEAKCDINYSKFPIVKGSNCDMICAPGEYLDVNGDQNCQKCSPGTFSVGNGVTFKEFSKPLTSYGFGIDYSHIRNAKLYNSSRNCSKSTWNRHTSGKYLISNTDNCHIALQYVAELKMAGEVTFEYLKISDGIYFHFYVVNDMCESESSSNVWPNRTTRDDWETVKMKLQKGTNILYWRAMSLSYDEYDIPPPPILLRNIDIRGVAFATACTDCPPGTFSKDSGASICEFCPKNTYTKGLRSTSCQSCNKNEEFSEIGATECSRRPLCTEKDYVEYYSPCENGMTTKKYKWIEPKLCLGDVDASSGGVQLPTSGSPEKCPPCNPGMFMNHSICSFCPIGTFSKGDKDKCQKCPPETRPDLMFNFQFWNQMPPNMKSLCLTSNEFCADNADPWILSQNKIISSPSIPDNAYSMLFMDVAGFRFIPQSDYTSITTAVGNVEFVFETQCSKDCVLTFGQIFANYSATTVEDKYLGTGTDFELLESFTGSSTKQKYTYAVMDSMKSTFMWAFSKVTSPELLETDNALRNDRLIIHSITVKHTIDGGAETCTSCKLGMHAGECVSCPKQHYFNETTKSCLECPKGFVVRHHPQLGKDECLECGPGLSSNDGIVCIPHKILTTSDDHVFNLTKLQAVTFNITTEDQFTSSGTDYKQIFRLNLVPDSSGSGHAFCSTNYTSSYHSNVTDLICRLNEVAGQGPNALLEYHLPTSIGHTLLAITPDREYNNATVRFPKKEGYTDLHFYYYAHPTYTCKKGRTSIVTLRCSPNLEDNQTSVIFPDKCRFGTCTGCDHHFMVSSRTYCPKCTWSDYSSIAGECVLGTQKSHYIWKSNSRGCIGDKLPEADLKKCPIFTRDIQVVVASAICVSILLLAVISYYWKRSKKLEYKYQRLIQGKDGTSTQFAPVDSCAIAEDEESEEDDEVHYSKPRKGIMSGLKFNTKGYDDEVTLQLTAPEDTRL